MSLYTADTAERDSEARLARRALDLVQLWQERKPPTLTPLLPVVLRLRGKPYSLHDHFPFEPFFDTFIPQRQVLKTGRQVSKSTGIAARGVLQSVSIPNFSTLYVTPLYEMVRRLSRDYIRPFVQESPLRRYWTSPQVSQNVLARSFVNNSRIYCSFAYLDVERTRGYPADQVIFDEVQNMNSLFIPVIAECTSASPYGSGMITLAGTSLTTDNTLELEWNKSSQAEWGIRCEACNYTNIPSLSHDLDRMTGPYHEDIGPNRPGLICAKCERPVNPRTGRWLHRIESKRFDYVGRHVPQQILPRHCCDPKNWRNLLAKRAEYSPSQYYNEVCGEAFDLAAKLITKPDLVRAATLSRNTPEAALPRVSQYLYRVLGIDWGGGGLLGLSWTCYAVAGMRPDGSIDVFLGRRSRTPLDRSGESQLAVSMARDFNCHYIAHDYLGPGRGAEQWMTQYGWSIDRIAAVCYTRFVGGPMWQFQQADRSYYQLDKPRSLATLCQQIQSCQIRFFQYEQEYQAASLLEDFLALTEHKIDNLRGSEFYSIGRAADRSDDFAHAVNFAVCALWNMSNRWPALVANRYTQLSQGAIEELRNQVNPWQGDDAL